MAAGMDLDATQTAISSGSSSIFFSRTFPQSRSAVSFWNITASLKETVPASSDLSDQDLGTAREYAGWNLSCLQEPCGINSMSTAVGLH